MIAAELLALGFVVLKPLGDNQRYDLVVDSKGVFYKIQCKTAISRANQSVLFPTASTYAHRGGQRKTYQGQVDYIIAYEPVTREIFWEIVDENTPGSSRTLVRTENSRGYVLASDRVMSKFPLL